MAHPYPCVRISSFLAPKQGFCVMQYCNPLCKDYDDIMLTQTHPQTSGSLAFAKLTWNSKSALCRLRFQGARWARKVFPGAAWGAQKEGHFGNKQC